MNHFCHIYLFTFPKTIDMMSLSKQILQGN
jgi:hypothetical protein